MAWCTENSSFFSVQYGSLEWESWRDYFEGIGYMPAIFRAMTWGDAWTAPAQWASQFDMELPKFPPVRLVPLGRKQQWTDGECRQKLTELRRRYGPHWGINQVNFPTKRARAGAPTDDQLRARYPIRQDSENPAPCDDEEAIPL